MIVKILRAGGKDPLVIADATMMIVETSGGNPVSVACEYGIPGPDGSFCVSHVNDPTFNTVLRNLGIDKVVIPVDLQTLLRAPEDLSVITPR
jgi:hypothetical protein